MLKDLTGKKFERLTVLKRTYEHTGRAAYWLCECICGKKTVVRGSHLRKKAIKSCGCLQKEIVKQIGYDNRTHGMSRTKIWSLWGSMNDRCFCENNSSYKNYGGRGITVCERYRTFEGFYEDFSERPENTTLDRIDNNGNYSCGKCEQCIRNNWPKNCKWSSYEEQGGNKRNNHNVTIGDKTQCLAAWIRELHINEKTVYSRLQAGWDDVKALTHPVS